MSKILPRIDGEKIYSYVFNYGIENRLLFKEEEDYKLFLSYIEDYLSPPKDPVSCKTEFKIKGKTFQGTPHQPKNYFNQVELVAYQLSPGRYNLLLHQIIPGSLEKFIRSLCTRYSIYYNKKYQHSGGVFSGPYNSTQISNTQEMAYLTRQFHKNSKHSSYSDYIAITNRTWVKPEAVLSKFQSKGISYQDFVEKHHLNNEELALINRFIPSEKVALPSDPLSNLNSINTYHSESKTRPKSKARTHGFFATSIFTYLLLSTLGFRQVFITTNSLPELSDWGEVAGIAKVIDIPTKTPEPVHETSTEINPETNQLPAEEILPSPDIASLSATASPSATIVVSVKEASISANIRQEPSTESPKISQAKRGDIFTVISHDLGWFQIQLPDGSVGFVSDQYMQEQELSSE